ncbi:DUF2057 family protein [Ferrimonas balearica]|uniref:DUF2057 family protein n=1 Tax=Ferrimonas balearica TaxID=44012 RepID=UPI001C99336B|nr:DUF2057 family protein [Ferrimonas balearica]MBY5923101.1 DUF2057 domain-containing protein [Ferrimonas balearica]MBY5997523.1 DUF2057 domain-containing protein [Ferrimonas balearica]
MRTLAFALLALFTGLTQAGELHLPEGFYATAVNGQPVSPYEASLSLTTGKQVVTLRYANPYLFHKEFHEVVVSAPLYLVFNATDQHYRIQATLPTELDAARRFAKQPRFELLSQQQPVPYETYRFSEAVNALLSR